ncbi:MAG: Long-chain-fatty-acid--CoA ligase, partial [Frankiales bacterium]|nr:Long-chain-fatty-acid--CoA ligase [Frankiales bacterium]
MRETIAAVPASPRPPRRRTAAPAASPYDARPWLASYPERVPHDYDFPTVPVTRLLDDAAASFPTGPALAFLGTTLTYRELRQQVDAFASALQGLGVTKGDRVAIVLPNCPQNVIAFFATLRLGAVVVQHNPLYTAGELQHQLADCGATVVVCLDRVYETVASVRARTSVQHVVVTSLADYLPAAARLQLRLPLKAARRRRAELESPLPKGAQVRSFVALVKGAGLPARQVPVDATTDVALLQYTGGTTGVAQGAQLTHHNLVSDTYMNRLWDSEATAGKEVTLGVLPLFHVYGLTVAMLNTVLLSGTLVLLPRFDVDRVLEAVDTHRPTLFPGVPPLFRALAENPKTRDHDLSSLRLCLSGAMRLPADVQEAFGTVTGARLVEGYGTTETSPSTHCGPTTGELRPGSIGLPLPGTRCKLVAQDDPTREVAVGEPGELAVAGPQVFAGYWGGDDAAAVRTPDGYLLTGDIAVMDEDGWFTVVDRKKELIISGGFNVYPSEVEAALAGLDGVVESVVVGVPDRFRGETVKAYVVQRGGLTESDVLAHCAAELTAYKVPRAVEFLDDLPRSGVGKVLRRVLVQAERDKAAAAEQARPASTPGGRRRP